MIQPTLAARPTEYKGIVFRSKSEAILARALDLVMDAVWEYEPLRFRQADGWVPDFFVGWPSIPLDIILEYKPCPVTQTYRRELWERFSRIGGVTRALATGDSFGTHPFLLEFWNQHELWVPSQNLGWAIKAAMQEARHYRFEMAVD